MNRLLLSAVATIMASACREPPPPPPPNPLVATRWIMGEDADDPTIEFSENRASGNAGCNRWFGQADSHHPQLRFSSIGATRRACSEDVMDTEQAFFSVLHRTQSARIEGDTLILLDADGRELARLSKLP